MMEKPLSARFFLALFVAGLLAATIVAAVERAPGYMDAEYYYAGALRLAAGQGATEPYLWHYLNDPKIVPAPSFAYWMPLISVIAAGGVKLVGGWWGARIPFLLLAGCIPPLTALLALRISGRALHSRLAGVLALFSGFYLAYLPTTDAFALAMVLGALFLLATFEPRLTVVPVEARLFLLGGIAGLMHLARADGILWLTGAAWAGIVWHRRLYRSLPWPNSVLRLAGLGLAAALGYGLVMTPWFARNVQEWGSLFPPGSARALWITQYEETMVYPASLLTSDHWQAAGFAAHAQARLDALGTNLQSALAVQGGIVLLPFVLAGLFHLRRSEEARLGGMMWLLMLALMTLVFPFAGKNGGFFHSGAALQPLWWAVVPVGVERLAHGYARVRPAINPRAMGRFFAVLVVAISALLTVGLTYSRIIGEDVQNLTWDAGQRHYREVEQVLVEAGATPCEPVLVNNAPGYWLASERPAVVIPWGGVDMLLAAAERYDARYLVLENHNPPMLGDLYRGKVHTVELEYLSAVGTTQIYRISLGGAEGAAK